MALLKAAMTRPAQKPMTVTVMTTSMRVNARLRRERPWIEVCTESQNMSVVHRPLKGDDRHIVPADGDRDQKAGDRLAPGTRHGGGDADAHFTDEGLVDV